MTSDADEGRLRRASERIAALHEEVELLYKVLVVAREVLFVSTKGSPDDLGGCLGRLNLACKAHWDYETGKNAALTTQPKEP